MNIYIYIHDLHVGPAVGSWQVTQLLWLLFWMKLGLAPVKCIPCCA